MTDPAQGTPAITTETLNALLAQVDGAAGAASGTPSTAPSSVPPLSSLSTSSLPPSVDPGSVSRNSQGNSPGVSVPPTPLISTSAPADATPSSSSSSSTFAALGTPPSGMDAASEHDHEEEGITSVPFEAAPPIVGTTSVAESPAFDPASLPSTAIPDMPPSVEGDLSIGMGSAPTTTPAPIMSGGGVTGMLGGAGGGNLADILVSQGALTAEQLAGLQQDQLRSGKTIEQLIVERNLVSVSALTKAKAELYHLPFVQIGEVGIAPEALSVVPESVAHRYHLLPFALDKQARTLSVAMANPLDLTAIDFVEKQTGYRLIPHFATPMEVDRLTNERYAQSLSTEVSEAIKETKFATAPSLNNLQQLSKEVVREAPITKIVETVLGFAVKARASDIHIEPQEDHTRIRYRIDGILTEKLILPRTVHDAVISRVKILSGMKIDEKRLPQDGRFSFSVDGEELDLRVSTLPTVHGEKVVLRLLKKNATVPNLSELGLRGQALRDVEECINLPHGIVLITGPTGSGKTTTLYSILHQINTPKVNISTLEDPVEYQISGVNQVQINPGAGLTFASGLRSFLRQDPNIIMVGEIRDRETAELAVQASLTGHLVFSTLHTNSAAGAIPRLLDMGVEPFLLASSLTLVIGQRVLRRLNQAYVEEYTPDSAVAEDVKTVLGPLYPAWCTQHQKDPDKLVLYRAKQERPETEPEYKDRQAIFEVMRVGEEMTRLMLERKSAQDIAELAKKRGTVFMKQDGYLKSIEGETTLEEVIRVAED